MKGSRGAGAVKQALAGAAGEGAHRAIGCDLADAVILSGVGHVHIAQPVQHESERIGEAGLGAGAVRQAGRAIARKTGNRHRPADHGRLVARDQGRHARRRRHLALFQHGPDSATDQGGQRHTQQNARSFFQHDCVTGSCQNTKLTR